MCAIECPSAAIELGIDAGAAVAIEFLDLDLETCPVDAAKASEFLQRGGRIGKAQAIAGSLLNLRPVLSVEDGVVIPVARVRGKQKALAEFERRFVEATTDGPGLRIAIAHANAEEWVGTLSELAWRVRPQAEIEFTSTLGAVVGTHVGPGAVGFFWFQDTD